MSSAGLMILRAGRCSNVAINVNGFHSSSATYLNQYWRQRKGLIANPNKYGSMVTLPDYSFKDNRPTPYGSRQLDRMKKHQEYAVHLSHKMTYCLSEVLCSDEKKSAGNYWVQMAYLHRSTFFNTIVKKRVLQLIGEIDHAVDKHARSVKEEKDKKDQILANKLKPKGQQLLTSE